MNNCYNLYEGDETNKRSYNWWKDTTYWMLLCLVHSIFRFFLPYCIYFLQLLSSFIKILLCRSLIYLGTYVFQRAEFSFRWTASIQHKSRNFFEIRVLILFTNYTKANKHTNVVKSAHIYWYTSTFGQIYMHCKNVRFIQYLLTEDVQKNSKTKIPWSVVPLWLLSRDRSLISWYLSAKQLYKLII